MEFWGLIIPFITLWLYAGMFLANGSILYGILFARYMTDASRTHLARVWPSGHGSGLGPHACGCRRLQVILAGI